MRINKSGFTIVELLIVIVVIAILAAISIVAYNGIQSRAENTKTANSLAAYAKVVTLYSADQGVYPTPATSYPCLGSVSYCGNMTDSGAGCEGSGRASPGPAFKTQLASYASNLPDPSTQSMNCGGKNYSGAWYNVTSAGKGGEMQAYYKGLTVCPNVVGMSVQVSYQANETMACRYRLPTLT